MQIVTALRRLGYLDKPSVGDHIHLFKKLDHPDGPVTIRTGVDAKHIGRSDVDRVREDTKLDDDAMWAAALKRDLPVDDYDRHLKQHPKRELVIAFWRDKFG